MPEPINLQPGDSLDVLSDPGSQEIVTIDAWCKAILAYRNEQRLKQGQSTLAADAPLPSEGLLTHLDLQLIDTILKSKLQLQMFPELLLEDQLYLMRCAVEARRIFEQMKKQPSVEQIAQRVNGMLPGLLGLRPGKSIQIPLGNEHGSTTPIKISRAKAPNRVLSVLRNVFGRWFGHLQGGN